MTSYERGMAMQYIIENAGGFEGKTPEEIRAYLIEKGDDFIQMLAGSLQKDWMFGPNSRL